MINDVCCKLSYLILINSLHFLFRIEVERVDNKFFNIDFYLPLYTSLTTSKHKQTI